MDRLDRFSILFIVILAGALILLGRDMPEGSVSKAGDAGDRQAGVMLLDAHAPEIKRLKQLIAVNNIRTAEKLLAQLLAKYPYEGEPYMLKGDIMMRKQDPVGAVFAYREAVDLNPDYVDKKTPLFQGRKIKVALQEAKESLRAVQSEKMGSREVKSVKKTIYYLLRRLAGSCG